MTCHRWALASVLLFVGSSCAIIEVPESNLLERGAEEYAQVRASVPEAWKAVVAEASARERNILVMDAEDGIVSWIDDSADMTKLDSSLLDLEPAEHADQALTAITTVHVVHAQTGTRLYVQRSYFPSKSVEGIALSRGDYEHHLVEAVRKRLGEDQQ